MLCVIVAAGRIGDYARHRALLAGVARPDLVLCADGGLAHLERLGLEADEILGDFDSADPAALDSFARRGAAIRRFPRDKDYTDTELAVNRAISGGCARILILGGLGARSDHATANIQLAFKSLDSGARVVLADEYSMVAVIRNETLVISRRRLLQSMLCGDGGGACCGAPAGERVGGRSAGGDPPGAAQGHCGGESVAPAVAGVEVGAPPSPAISILPIGGEAAGVCTRGLKYPISGMTLPASYTTGVSNEFLPCAETASVSVDSGALLIMVSCCGATR
ncbi:MAG: thiamine diphosphokinase [Clostridiales bacterium]|jgi:thiamine pyrophosphokinase|nr:thiamine diphosphokinase [Clostridiales bacterium]